MVLNSKSKRLISPITRLFMILYVGFFLILFLHLLLHLHFLLLNPFYLLVSPSLLSLFLLCSFFPSFLPFTCLLPPVDVAPC